MPDGDGYLSEFNTEGAASRTAEKYRALNAGKWHPAGGISAQPGRRPGGLVLSALSSPNRWQVTAGFGVATSAVGDVYEFSVSANASDNVAATSSGTTRLDRFVVRVRDKSRGDTENSVRVERIAGTETTGTPVLPTTGLTGAVFLDVGTMLINSSGPSTVTPSSLFLSALGGIRPVTQAQRDALVAAGDVYPGLSVYNTNTKSLNVWNGSAWSGRASVTPFRGYVGGGTTQLTAGSGSEVGVMTRSADGMVDYDYVLNFNNSQLGATSDAIWTLSLPTPAASVVEVSGTGFISRATGPVAARGEYPLHVYAVNTTTVVTLDTFIAPGRRVGAGYFAWAAGDRWIVNVRYREA